MIKLMLLFMHMLLILCAMIRCSVNSPLAGGSEIGNPSTVTGLASYPDNNGPAKGASVRLRKEGYVSDTTSSSLGRRYLNSYDKHTNENGAFRIDSVDTGSYWIEVNDGAGYAAVSKIEIVAEGSAIKTPQITLHAVAKIKGTVTFGETPGNKSYIQVYGLERLAIPDETGSYAIDLPADTLTLRLTSSSQAYRPFSMRHIIMNPDSVLVVPPLTFYKECEHGICDSVVVREMLDSLGFPQVPVNDRTTRNSSGRITDIDFGGLSISRIPYSINKLSELKRISANGCALSSIPLSIFTVRILRGLHLRNNTISRIPDEIAWTPELDSLDIGANQLQAIPDEIAYLKMLTFLACDSNQLVSVADEVGLLPNLKTFRAAHNLLLSLPSKMQNLANLRELDISYNEFELLPSVVMKMTSLISLHIEGNRICAPADSVILYLNSTAPGWLPTQDCQ